MAKRSAKLRAWPADSIERWPLAKIVPYERNPRLHSEEQIAQIAASMKRFGVTTPVLVDEDGELIYGHGRLAAAKLLGLRELPVAIARGWTDAEKRAYRIADNQLGLNSEWDLPLLKIELGALADSGFDMPLLGFSSEDMIAFNFDPQATLDDDGDSGTERELTASEKTLMIEAWKRLAADWVGIIEGTGPRWVSNNHTRGALAVAFLRARFYGAEIPSAATLAYTPHRVQICGGASAGNKSQLGSLLDGLRDAMTNENDIVERLWFLTAGRPRFDQMLGMTLPFYGYRLPGEFPSRLARDLYNEFVTVPGARVLDPCHGWGGRPLGFLLSDHAVHYHGFEVDPDTSKGVRAMLNDLARFALPGKTAELEVRPFEDAKLHPGAYDFALTSPPYFDVERYGGKLSSWRRYKTFEAWVVGFYKPMIVKVMVALKPGGFFALQIGNQTWPLEQTAVEIAGGLGMTHVETRAAGMPNNWAKTEESEGELILVLEKPEVARRKKGRVAIREPAEAFGRVL